MRGSCFGFSACRFETTFNRKAGRYGAKSVVGEIEADAKVFDAEEESLQAVRPRARLYASVWFVPHLFSFVGAPGAHSRRCQSELVR